MSDEVLTAEKRKQLVTGAEAKAIVPTNFDDLVRIANVIAETKMAPKSYDNDIGKITIGLMTGLELGLTPMMALQSIAVINGQPSLWGDGMLAMCLTHLDDYRDAVVDDGAEVTVKRGGVTVTRRFTLDDAKKAGLLGKDPWQKYPKRMLLMRARSWALRDTCADLLKGLKSAEEVMDYDVDLTRNDEGDFVPNAPAAHTEPPAPVELKDVTDEWTFETSDIEPEPDTSAIVPELLLVEPEPEPEPEPRSPVLDELEVDLAFTTNEAQVRTVMKNWAEAIGGLSEGNRAEAEALYEGQMAKVRKR